MSITDQEFLHVVDTTARPDFQREGVNGAIMTVSGARRHEQLVDGAVKVFSFEHAVPTKLPFAIAMKFLKTEGFVLTDENGKPIEFERVPDQPNAANSAQFKLAGNQVVARYDELSQEALLIRAAQLPGGEVFKKNAKRAEIIDFLIKTRAELEKINSQRDGGTASAEAEDMSDEDSAKFFRDEAA